MIGVLSAAGQAGTDASLSLSAPVLDADGNPAAVLPRQPRTVRDTGLDARLVTALVIKTLHADGKTPLSRLTGRLRLSVSVLREVLQALVGAQQAEVAYSGDSDLDVHYQLTAPGQRAAAEHLAESRYVGPAPVTLAAWRAMVTRQSQRQPDAARVTRTELDAVLDGDPLAPAIREQIGAALYSGRPLLLYGPSGSGKTTLARKLARLRQDPIAVPYAVLVNHEIIGLYDPALHPVPLHAARAGRAPQRRRTLGAVPASAGACGRRAGARHARAAQRPGERRAARAAPPPGQQRLAGGRRSGSPARTAGRTAAPLARRTGSAAGPRHGAGRRHACLAVRCQPGAGHQPGARVGCSTTPACAASATGSRSARCRSTAIVHCCGARRGCAGSISTTARSPS